MTCIDIPGGTRGGDSEAGVHDGGLVGLQFIVEEVRCPSQIIGPLRRMPSSGLQGENGQHRDRCNEDRNYDFRESHPAVI